MQKNICQILLIACLCFIITGCESTGSFISPTPTSQTILPSRASINDAGFWEGSPAVIWDHLQRLPASQLQAAVTTDNDHLAWIKLAMISKRSSANTQQLVDQLIAWRAAYPHHLGNTLFASNSALQSLSTQPRPTHLALLLPLKGPLSSSGQAVRDGFLSAYYAALKTHTTPQTITFYDTSQPQSIAALYQQAVSAGASMVIGPLTKQDVQALLRAGQPSVPTLALNYTDTGPLPNRFYEFGLSPLDEALQVADKAWQANHHRALVITSDTLSGHSVAKSLTTRWETLGGSIQDIRYFSSQTDLTQGVAEILHVDPQNDRRKNVNKTLLEHQRRQDIDVIFLLTEPAMARQIMPLLRYYYADSIPVYSTSMIYTGTPDPASDNDLNGAHFCDIPWLLTMKRTSNRLVAVGQDAYTLSNDLARFSVLPNFPLYATTGALTLKNNQQFYRRLPWTEMRNGHPE